MNERIGTIVALLRDRINPGLDNIVQRDGEFLRAACEGLALPITPANVAQVATLLGVMGIPTHESYPKMMYHANRPSAVVANEDEAKALGDGWSDTPVKAI